jgi:hypothetical protein
MSASPSVVIAAASLAEWARARRRVWTDVPLDVSAPVFREATPAIEETFAEPVATIDASAGLTPDAAYETWQEVVADTIAPGPMLTEPMVPEPLVPESPVPEPLMFGASDAATVDEGPTAFERAVVVARALAKVSVAAARVTAYVGRGAGELLIAIVDRLVAMREPAFRWMIRGAALASTASVAGLVVVNRGELFTRWDHMSSMVVAAANRPQTAPAPVLTLPDGVGRLTVTSGETEATVLVDGAAHGTTPVTMNLPAGPHRILLRSPQGSVERAIRIQSGESSEINEAIYPGWVALTAAVDVTLSEGGKPLKRDDRGWAILPPGPHDIHLDNRVLGVHEVRRVVVTPGDTTRLSFATHTSSLSLTTNELADVWIDGQPYGQAPLVDQPIPIGVHDVRVRSAAHERWLRIRATVQPVQVNVDLTADR